MRVVAVVLHFVFEFIVNVASLDELDVVAVVAARPHQDAHEVQGVAQVLQQRRPIAVALKKNAQNHISLTSSG